MQGRSETVLPNDKSLDMTKLKAFADDKLNVAKITISLFDSVEKTLWEKEKMLVTSNFSFSHSVFQSLFFMVVKSRDCMVKS